MQIDLSHHAYLVIGDSKTVQQQVLTELSKQNFEISNNPDLVIKTFDKLLIDDVRELNRQQSLSAVGISKKVFIIIANTIPVIAQNAMLKMLEEPNPSSVFILILPSDIFLLPTLLSRLMRLEGSIIQGISDFATEDFLSATLPKRFKMIDQFLAQHKDSEAGQYLRQKVWQIFGDIEQQQPKTLAKNVSDFYELKSHVFDPSASMKMLLEALAILV